MARPPETALEQTFKRAWFVASGMNIPTVLAELLCTDAVEPAIQHRRIN
jgi:hypothetical protein